MNILIISDKFSQGGLETHIDTMYELLKENNNIIFAFSSYQKGKYLKNAEVIEGFNFRLNSSIKEFCNDIDRLVSVIKENRIEVIHVHPFYCIFPALFAANITNTKIVFTYHGRMSLNFISSCNEQILYYFAIENIFNKIFCVAEDAIPWFNNFKKNQAVFFPNILDETKYKEHKVIKNRKWALVSRLDNDKIEEIEKIIRYLPNLEIESIDIYGSGLEEENLKILVQELKLQKKVKFKGYKENIFTCLDNNYNGVIGLGRVAIEALTMNYPVILIGYGKVCGLINDEILNHVQKDNFVTTEIKEKTLDELRTQITMLNKNLKNYQFREKMINDFGKNKIYDYIKEINNSQFSGISLFNSIYKEIKLIDNQEEEFYNSYKIFMILAKLANYSKNIDLKSNVNIYQKIYSLNYNFYSNEQLYKNVNNKITENNNIILNFSKNIEEIQKKMKEIQKETKDNTERINNIKAEELIRIENDLNMLKNNGILKRIKNFFNK